MAKKWSELLHKSKLRGCTLNKPLYMVIPDEGVTIPCPIHPKGHFIKAPPKPEL